MKLTWLSSFLLSATLSAQTDIEMIAMGFALRDSVMVYADSTQSAKTLGRLRFADYVTVIGLQENGKAQFNRSGWCRIERRGGEKGWMRFADLAVGDHVGLFFAMGDSVFDRPDSRAKFKWKLEIGLLLRCTMRSSQRGQVWLGDYRGWLRVRKFEPSLGDAYYKLMAAYEGWPFFENLKARNDFETALRVIDKLASLCAPHDTLYLDGGLHDLDERNTVVGAGAAIAYLKSSALRSLKRNVEAQVEFEKIEKLYPHHMLFNGRAGAYAALQSANNLLHQTHDTTRALEKYHEVIRKYPSEAIFGFEWNDWVDDAAARAIISLNANKPEQLGREAQRIIAETNLPVIKLIGYSGLVRSLGLRGELAAMRDTTLAVIARHSAVTRNFYLSTLTYTNKVATAALRVYEERGDYAGFNAMCDSLILHSRDDLTGAAAALRKAMLADRTNTEVASVKQLYQRVIDGFPEFNFYEPNVGDLATYVARQRLEALAEAGLRRAEVIGVNVPLRLGLVGNLEPYKHLPRGLYVRVLYDDATFTQGPNTVSHTKIMLDDGTIGWVENKNIRISYPALLRSRGPNRKSWDMQWANAQNNPAFSESGIMKPRIRSTLDAHRFYDLRVQDVNNDDRLDFIVRSKNGGFSALDGNHSLKPLWSAPASNMDPALGDGVIFYLNITSTTGKPFECVLHATNLADGKTLWRRSFGPMVAADLLYFDQRIYVLAQDNFLFCVRANDGEYLWKIAAGPNGQRPVKLGINQRALVAVSLQSMRAFDPMSGTALWERTLDLSNESVPTLAHEKVYLAVNGQLKVFALKDGSLVWQKVAASRVHGNPCVVNERGVFVLMNEGVVALRESDGALLWQSGAIQSPSSLIASSDLLYLQTMLEGKAHLLALQQRTGQTAWTFPLTREERSNMIYQDGFILLEGRTGIVVIGDSL